MTRRHSTCRAPIPNTNITVRTLAEQHPDAPTERVLSECCSPTLSAPLSCSVFTVMRTGVMSFTRTTGWLTACY